MAQWDSDYVFNGSMDSMRDTTARRDKATTEVVIGSLLTVWIVVVNTGLISAILMTRSLRQQASNWLLVNLAVADLLVGLLVTSFTAYQRGHDLQWELSHHVCVFWLLLDILLGCVSMYMLISINIDRCMFISYPSTYQRKMTRIPVVCLMAACWVVAACIVLPFFFKGRTDGFSIKDNIDVSEMCYIELLPRYSIASSILTYFIPGVVLIGITGLTFRAALHKVRDHQRRLLASSGGTSGGHVGDSSSGSGHVGDSSSGHVGDCGNEENSALGRVKKAVFVVCVINVVYLSMWLPFFFINLLSAADMYHALSPRAFDVAIWLAYANSGVNPLVWLLYPDIRKAVLNLLRCRFDRNKHGFYLDDEDTEDVPITTNVEA